MIEEFLEGNLAETLRGRIEDTLLDLPKGLEPEEAAVIALLQRRLAKRSRRRK